MQIYKMRMILPKNIHKKRIKKQIYVLINVYKPFAKTERFVYIKKM
jgi:hypothetical protein